MNTTAVDEGVQITPPTTTTTPSTKPGNFISYNRESTKRVPITMDAMKNNPNTNEQSAYEIQPVSDTHYTAPHYDERHRWPAYWYQIDAIRRTQAKSILEIGPGSGMLNSYLKNQLNLDVTTYDYDSRIHPDVQGDIREIQKKIPANSFDAVIAFQVLEHIPFEALPATLEQLKAITRRYFIVSVPFNGTTIQVRLHIWRLKIAISRKIPRNRNWKFDGLHHWEVGTLQYPLSKVTQVFSDSFNIDHQYFCPDYAYHYFFECTKK